MPGFTCALHQTQSLLSHGLLGMMLFNHLQMWASFVPVSGPLQLVVITAPATARDQGLARELLPRFATSQSLTPLAREATEARLPASTKGRPLISAKH